MLEVLTVKNFKAYKKATLIFHEGVNVIVGESDEGKSAIMQALKWIMFNKPGGDEFINWWSKDGASVKVRVDGKTIKRVKGKENAYYIGKERYVSFGTGIPEDVKNLLNMEDVNIQNQLDTHFLLGDNPGEVARYFNKIVDLDIIDRSMRNIQKQLKEEQGGLLNSKSEVASLEESLKAYDWLMSAEDQLRKIENLNRTIIKTSTQVTEIADLLSEIQSVETDKIPLNKLLSARESVDELVILFDSITETDTKINGISALLEEIKKIEKQKLVYTKLVKAKSEVASLMALLKDIGLKQTECLELSNIISGIEKIDKEIWAKTKEKKLLQKEFTKSMPDICPLCEGVKNENYRF